MIQKPKGTADILPGQVEIWQYIESTAREILHNYRFFEIRTPMFESFELFSRGVGETTDVITKEMYDFYDKGDRHIALKPEGTAPIARAFVENKLYAPEEVKPYKVYYMGPMFRYERPQSGRQRQFNQLGVEVFGGENAATDVETIALAIDILQALGVSNYKLVINSLGSEESRQTYRQALIDYLEPYYDQLSEDSQTRLHQNPLRVLDSKDPKDIEIVEGAPSILDALSEDSKERFQLVQELLTRLKIPFEIDANMVRGLDYYQETIFEIMTDAKDFGAQSTIVGGGNYDGLVNELSDGKQSVPGFGFAIGIERLILLMQAQGVDLPESHPLDVYVVNFGEEASKYATQITQRVRHAGFSCDRDFFDRKAKKQFKEADKLGADLVITIGDQEITDNQIQVKNMSSGKQESFSFEDLTADFSKIYEKMK
ncbi:histidine--tRNA ligase [Aerococcus kribbianus]|uniref:Histidine--tRNA ligase n=1 Tax=Aerococcus kribbianus TaxID=2999064 RepID=A0A9X3JCY0_9LACT|nr:MULTISPECIES: histidine--tRNA ligase [unclassified Aerococcus]MCZ0716930.1 histidine--tRNA ligase [Aerococcus sp. YH-aer221]MCZ0725218.1 histidine--tRNA ligase [Aerococcus sp. YH-aer222]